MIGMICAVLCLQDGLLKEGDAVKPVEKWFDATGIKKGDARRVLGLNAWKDFWTEHIRPKEAELPEIDFKKHMVLVLAVDVYMGCLQVSLKSLEIRETKEALRVIPTVARGGCDNSMHGHPIGLARRALIVVLPRSSKRVDWVEIPRQGAPKVARTLEATKE